MEKNVNVVITDFIDGYNQNHFIMSEIAFTAISWFIATYALGNDFNIEMVDDFKPEVLPF